jgi:hypothetical protein
MPQHSEPTTCTQISRALSDIACVKYNIFKISYPLSCFSLVSRRLSYTWNILVKSFPLLQTPYNCYRRQLGFMIYLQIMKFLLYINLGYGFTTNILTIEASTEIVRKVNKTGNEIDYKTNKNKNKTEV